VGIANGIVTKMAPTWRKNRRRSPTLTREAQREAPRTEH